MGHGASGWPSPARCWCRRGCRAPFEGSKLRFVYVSKTDDYVGSSRAFTAKVGKTTDSDDAPASGGSNTNFGGDSGGGLGGGGGDGNCAGIGC